MPTSKHSVQIERDEHDETANAKRVSLVGGSITATSQVTVVVQNLASAATLYAVVNTSAAGQASVVLDTGTRFIGLTTSVIASAPTLYAVVNTGASNSNVTLNPSPNFIGLVTAVAGGTFPVTAGSGVTVFQGTTPWVSSGTVYVNGSVVVADGGGSLTVDNNGTFAVQAAQSGSWDTRSLLSAATLYAVVNTGTSNSNTTLNPSPNFIGLVTAVAGAAFPVTDNGASLTVDGTVAATQSGSWDVRSVLSAATLYAVVNTGGSNSNVTLNPSPNFIGLVTAVAGGNFPITHQSNVTLNASSAFIGLVTSYPSFSVTTSFATVISSTQTIFAPPASQRIYLHELMINALGATQGAVQSGNTDLIPFAGLATTGGFFNTFGERGLPFKAVNNTLGVRLAANATVSILATVHFES